jgi:hypothetical protein
MQLNPADRPSMNNMYNSSYTSSVQSDEMRRSTEMYNKAKQPLITGIIPSPSFASAFRQVSDMDDEAGSGDFISPLSGQRVRKEDMKHSNMQPFLKGNITQNTNIEKFSSKLDKDTGMDKFYVQKREVESIFKPTSQISNINGGKGYNDFLRSRINPSRINNNISPVDKVYVGPGLNKGYTSQGTGGYQQSDGLDYARPKTLDELRSKVDQRQTVFKMPFKASAKGTDQRGVVTPYKKNKPERTYGQTEDNWFKTTGTVLKTAERPALALKNPMKQDMHTEYKGGAILQDVKGMAEFDDYGKKNVIVYNNERQFTQSCTVVNNFSTNVKAMITPVVDAIRLSLKEYMVDATRAGGNPQAQMPNKLAAHDPSDVLRTTVKETTSQDSDQLNLTGPSQTYSAAQDEAKTTVKETLIHDSDILNIKTNPGLYAKNDDEANTTIRETLPLINTNRNLGTGIYKVYVYDPDIAMRTTTKQTTVKSRSEMGFIGGVINNILGGYATTEVEMKNTHKQFTTDQSDYTQYSVAKAAANFRPTSREAEYNGEYDDAREQLLIEAGHTPNPGNMNIPIDKSDITMKSDKLIADSYAVREAGNLDKIYGQLLEVEEDSLTRDTKRTNAFEDRLDGSILSALKTNELSIHINPI